MLFQWLYTVPQPPQLGPKKLGVTGSCSCSNGRCGNGIQMLRLRARWCPGFKTTNTSTTNDEETTGSKAQRKLQQSSFQRPEAIRHDWGTPARPARRCIRTSGTESIRSFVSLHGGPKREDKCNGIAVELCWNHWTQPLCWTFSIPIPSYTYNYDFPAH